MKGNGGRRMQQMLWNVKTWKVVAEADYTTTNAMECKEREAAEEKDYTKCYGM